ncbi:hypothetical protein DHEL01_v202934 [Diaporthe helianthi]|uniref:Uncharacterized protein n=1 Tax=Diaporthe helianthi TaxID=158607 RepID=A0A2P5I850_DIAHE|nr:hypothetical protein DHEL01_v202934 [Diaporthe helianthi]
MELKVNEVLTIFQERGLNANDVLAALRLQPSGYDRTNPSPQVDMPSVNQQPVEMSVDERPAEMTGSRVDHELSVAGINDVNGNRNIDSLGHEESLVSPSQSSPVHV